MIAIVTHIYSVLMNFDPFGVAELFKFVSLIANPNTFDKVAIPGKLLQVVITGYVNVKVILVNGNATRVLKLSSPRPNGTNLLATAVKHCNLAT